MQHCTAVEGRRVAIHCHAGLGRTGLAAACFLVFTRESPSAAAAVAAVRAARPGALQTPAQVLFVSIFEQYLAHLRCAFRAADPSKLFLGRESFFVARTSQALRRTQSSRGSSNGGSSFGRGSDGAAAAAAAAEAALLVASDPVSAAAALGPVAISPVVPADAGRHPSSGSDPTASSDPGGPAPPPQQQQQHPAPGFVMHARRLSGGGGSMKLLCNPLDAIKEDDRPMHVITTEMAVTEVYGDGLTIIRAAPGCRDAAERPLKLEQVGARGGVREGEGDEGDVADRRARCHLGSGMGPAGRRVSLASASPCGGRRGCEESCEGAARARLANILYEQRCSRKPGRAETRDAGPGRSRREGAWTGRTAALDREVPGDNFSAAMPCAAQRTGGHAPLVSPQTHLPGVSVSVSAGERCSACPHASCCAVCAFCHRLPAFALPALLACICFKH
jgi:hypothetical protein